MAVQYLCIPKADRTVEQIQSLTFGANEPPNQERKWRGRPLGGEFIHDCPDCHGPIEDNGLPGEYQITDLRCQDVAGCGWHITTEG